jgi:cholesterol transport system auxiliary component
LNSRYWWSGAILASALAGCGGEGVPVPSDRFHRLTVGEPATVYETPQLEGTVEVDRFNAAGVLQDRAIIFIEHDNPNVMHQYHYHLWSDPPTRMLQIATVDYLRAAHMADQVVKTGRRIIPAYTLTGDIKRLEHVVGNSSSVLVELEFGLRGHKDGNLVWVKSYTVNKAVDDDSVETATRAIGEAVEEILASLSVDLAKR